MKIILDTHGSGSDFSIENGKDATRYFIEIRDYEMTFTANIDKNDLQKALKMLEIEGK